MGMSLENTEYRSNLRFRLVAPWMINPEEAEKMAFIAKTVLGPKLSYPLSDLVVQYWGLGSDTVPTEW